VPVRGRWHGGWGGGPLLGGACGKIGEEYEAKIMAGRALFGEDICGENGGKNWADADM